LAKLASPVSDHCTRRREFAEARQQAAAIKGASKLAHSRKRNTDRIESVVMPRAKAAGIRAELDTRIDMASGLSIFRFALEREFFFQPGQYATLWLTHRGETTPRPYSIASSPLETRSLEFYINLVEDGHLTPSLWDPEVMNALNNRSKDTTLAITGPHGQFVLDLKDPRDLVFVASGTGLAPFISMTRKLNEAYLADPEIFRARTVHIIHGVSHAQNLGYRSELEALNLETERNAGHKLRIFYFPTVSRPHLDPSWTGLRGRAEAHFDDSLSRNPTSVVEENRLSRFVHHELSPTSHAVYICGHPGTIDNAVRMLSARGFKPDVDLKVEKYYP
jgi:NAD(P)H-flavin reductase